MISCFADLTLRKCNSSCTGTHSLSTPIPAAFQNDMPALGSTTAFNPARTAGCRIGVQRAAANYLRVSISDHVICQVYKWRHQTCICLGNRGLHSTAGPVIAAM